MNELDLYKFYKDNALEYHWHSDNRNVSDYDDDVILFVDVRCIEEFMKLLSGSRLWTDGILCRMKDGYFCFWMAEICDYYGVNINEVFPK